jgi:nucleotide-binding universal stress UspA family protein
VKKILVPIDFSDCALAAADVALRIAKKAEAEVCFLHIIRTPVDWVSLPLEKEALYPDTKAEIGNAKSELTRLVNKAIKKGLTAFQLILFNKGRKGIEEHIEEGQYWLVAMGSHGAVGLKEFVGSNTQKVVRHSVVPVLVVKSKPSSRKFKKIVFASSFEKDDLESFKYVANLAEILGSKLLIFNSLSEEKGTRTFAHSINADLVAVTTSWRSGFVKTLSSNIAENLVNHAFSPILALGTVD